MPCVFIMLDRLLHVLVFFLSPLQERKSEKMNVHLRFFDPLFSVSPFVCPFVRPLEF